MLKKYRYESIEILGEVLILISFFVTLYTTAYKIDNNSFVGINKSTPINVLVDIILFTIQTFAIQNVIDIAPASVLAKSISCLQLVVFTVFISFILLGLGTYLLDVDYGRDKK